MLRLRGFTLLEILLVIFLMSLFITIPNIFKSLIERQSSWGFQQKLLAIIEFAMTESHESQQAVIICPTVDQKSCTKVWKKQMMVFIDQEGDQKVHSFLQILRIFDIAKGNLYWQSFPHQFSFLRFLSSNNMHNNNGTFWYCSINATIPDWAILMSKTGHIRVLNNQSGVLKDSQGKPLVC